MKGVPAPIQRWLAFLMPPLALIVCGMVIVPREQKLRHVNKDIVVARQDVQGYLAQIRAISSLPEDPTKATLPMTKQEQSDFLRGLSQLCNQSGNQILSVVSLAAPPPTQGAAPPPVAGAPLPLPDGVLAIKSPITFEGSFDSLRAFLSGLQQSQRLITLSDCHIGSGKGGFPRLQTTVTVSRYVDVPKG